MSEEAPTPLGTMQGAIQLAGFHYIVCLKALPTNADCRLGIDHTEYCFDSIRTADSNKLHAEFQRWAAQGVLRDLIESFSIFLMEVYRGAMLVKPSRSYSVPLDKFERMGIEDQLAVLARDFKIDDRWISRLVGYNRARNALAHRQGIVGPRDVTDKDELVIRWLTSKMELATGQEKPVVLDSPMEQLLFADHIQGAPVRVQVHDKEKHISLGSVVNFHPADILEISHTFQLAAAAFNTVLLPD